MTPQERQGHLRLRQNAVGELLTAVQSEMEALDNDYSDIQNEFERITGEKRRFVAYYDCGRGCYGCPHPYLIRIRKDATRRLSQEQLAAMAELRKRFYQVTRRRTKVSRILQALRMSTFRLGGISHRREAEASDAG
jgi:hypothetical protein